MKKTILIIFLLLCVSLISVIGANAPLIVTNVTQKVYTERFQIWAAVNETSLIKYSVSDASNTEIYRGTLTDNSSAAIINIGELEGNTLYYWQVNFTSLGETTTIYNRVTTNEYIFNNLARIILSLVIILILFMVITFIQETDMSIKDKLSLSFLAIIICYIITSIIYV